MRPSISSPNVFHALVPMSGDMKPAMSAGTFMLCHCFTRMPLVGISNMGRITWTPADFAFKRPVEKSDAPTGYLSKPATVQPFSLNHFSIMAPVPAAHSTSCVAMKTLLYPNSFDMNFIMLCMYPARYTESRQLLNEYLYFSLSLSTFCWNAGAIAMVPILMTLYFEYMSMAARRASDRKLPTTAA